MEESGMPPKRRFLLAASSVAGGIATLGAATPFFLSMFPSARARAAGAPVEVDISKVEPGMMIRVEWRGQPVWVVHRTPEMLEDVKKMDRQGRGPGLGERRFSPTTRRTSIARASRSTWSWSASALTSAARRRPSCKPGVESGLGDGLAGRLFLSLPRLQVRSRRPRVQGCAGADQSGGAAVQVS